MAFKHRHKSGELEFKLLLVATFPIFFVTTLFRRLLPWNWGRDKRSIISAALCAAYNSIPFAFM
jgi:hypothetical protein